MEPQLVFVYGSLKQGYHNNSLLSNAEFIGEFQTDFCWEMFSASPRGGYPVVSDGEFAIKGEIYYCNEQTIDRLDILEGNGHHYERELIYIPELNDWAWMYIFLYSVEDREQYPQEPFVEIDRDNWTQSWKQPKPQNWMQNLYQKWWLERMADNSIES